MIVALMFAAQSAVELAPPVSPSAADMTLPASRYKCSLRDINGEDLSFLFEIKGWRAFKTPQGIKHTETQIRMLKDPNGYFDGYVLESFDGREFRGVSQTAQGRFGEAFQAKIEQAEDTLTNDFKGRVMITIGEFRKPKMGLAPYHTATGFCDAIRMSQQPLSEAEAAEFVKQ